MLKGKTIIMVAQKINTIRDADNIIVLEKGRIAGAHSMRLGTIIIEQQIHAVAASLSDEQKEQLEKLTESVTDISSVSEREMFIIGFRLGVKLMIDVLK